MRMFGVAVMVIIGMAVGGYYALAVLQVPAEVAFATPGARVDSVERGAL